MGWKIIFAPRAHARVAEIVRFVAKDDPQAAVRFGDYLVDRAESLVNFPELGTPYRKRPNVRRLLCKSYLIYYRLRPKGTGDRDHGFLAHRTSRTTVMRNNRKRTVAENQLAFVARAQRAFGRVARKVRTENRKLGLAPVVWPNGKSKVKAARA